MICNPGDIVLVEVIFSEGGQSKKRPALVISCDDYNNSRQEIIVAAITSNTDRKLIGETKLKNWKQSGLKLPSVVTAVIQTIKKSLVVKKMGQIGLSDWKQVQSNLNEAIDI
jgi:mRNA interferase MazF